MTRYVIWDLLFRSPMASWLDDLGLNELEHIKDGASAFAQELHPINSAEDFISFVVALNLYPPGTPLRAERIAGEMPAGLSAPAVRYLLSKLPIVDRLASQLRDDPSRKTVRLVPDVEHCVACGLAGEAVPLVVKRADKCSSPTVYAEHGRLKGELNGLSCPRCSAWHSMSYAEGGTRIPAGKQVPYPGATASSRRWIQLSQSTVFENSLLDRLSAQMVHSHTGFETFCHEWAMRCGESKDLAHTMRRRLGHTWLAWSLLRWRDENASRAGEPLPFEPLGFTSDEQLDATLLEQCQGRDASGCLKPECLLSRFTAFWAGEHASRCLKPVPGSSTCDCYIIDGHHKYRRKCCSNRNARVVDMGKHGKATLGCSGMPVPGSRFCVRCRPFAARRTDQTAELEPGNQSTVTVDLSASEGLAAAFNLRLAKRRRAARQAICPPKTPVSASPATTRRSVSHAPRSRLPCLLDMSLTFACSTLSHMSRRSSPRSLTPQRPTGAPARTGRAMHALMP